MSGIGGYFSVDDNRISPEKLQAMVASIAHRGPDGNGTWHDGNVGLCGCLLHTTPESLHEKLPFEDKEAQLVITCDARIDNRDELLDALGLPLAGRKLITDSEVICAAYRKWGEGCADKLLGDFAIAIWDKREQKLICLRDHMGVKPFYYYWDGRFFAFASEIKALFVLLNKRPEISRQRVLDLIVFVYSDQHSTFYHNIFRLERASKLVVSDSGLDVSSYFSFVPGKRVRFRSDEEYAEAFREIFSEAVRCRLRSAFPVGSTLSGGLDSSSITCMARSLLRPTDHVLHTFSAIFPGLTPAELKLVDERLYMDAVIDQGGLQPHFIEADKLNPLDFLRRHDHEEPMPGFNMYIHEAMYEKACGERVRVFLDGLDGDTTVSHGYARLYDLGRNLQLSTLFREAKAVARHRNGGISSKRILKEFVLKPRMPVTLLRLLSKSQHDHFNTAGIDLLSSSGMAPRDWQKRSNVLELPSTIRQSARWKHYAELVSPSLQYVMELIDTVVGKMPLECRYPFWDRRLMEFCLAIPPDQKLSGGYTRVVMRRAMQGILPPEVEMRTGKANLSPNFNRHVRRDIEHLMTSYLSEGSELTQFVDAQKVMDKTALLSGRGGVPSDVTMMFVVASLGQWLRTGNRSEFEEK